MARELNAIHRENIDATHTRTSARRVARLARYSAALSLGRKRCCFRLRFLAAMRGAPHPDNPDAQCFDLRPLIDTAVYACTVAAYQRMVPRLRHALVDARADRLGSLA